MHKFLAMAHVLAGQFADIEERNKEKIEQLREEYANLKNLPRKKKKKEKKRIMLEFMIFSHNPLTGTTYDWV